MVATETSSSIIAWWGAVLSTLLAVVKLYELWRERFRVDVSYNFTGNASIGNEVLIRNLTQYPLILEHWELLYCTGRWPRRNFTFLASAELGAGDCRVEPYATHTLHFMQQHYFDWSHDALSGRKIFIRLHIAARKPILKFVYSQ